MPIWDQTTIAVTIRSTGTASTSMPERAGVADADAERGEQQREQPQRHLRQRARQRDARHRENTAANTSGRGAAAGGGGAARRRRGADVERGDLGLAEALGEVQRKHALEHSEREDGEQDRRGGDQKPACVARLGRSEQRAGWRARGSEHERAWRPGADEVGEERAVDAAESAERGADQAADGVGGEDAAHADVLLAGPALERVEGDADPDAAGSEAHHEPDGEVDAPASRPARTRAQPSATSTSEATSTGRAPRRSTARPASAKPATMPAGNDRHQQPDRGRARSGGVGDRGGDRDDDAVAGGVERAEASSSG